MANQGIRVNVVQLTDEQYSSAINTKNYDMLLCSINLSYSPNLETFLGNNNLSNYTNEEVKNILEEVKNTNDENILKEKYKRIAEIYKEEVPYISLYNNKFTVCCHSNLKGDVTPNWYNVFYNVAGWYK